MKQFKKNNAHKIKNYVPPQYLQSLQNRYLFNPTIRKFNLEHNKTNLFKAIFIELRSKCNSACTFCPVSIGNDKRGVNIFKPSVFVTHLIAFVFVPQSTSEEHQSSLY